MTPGEGSDDANSNGATGGPDAGTGSVEAVQVHEIVLTSSSRAEDAGYRAMADIAQLAAVLGAEYRVVGGQMTALLVAVHQATNAPARATADADFGTHHQVIGDPQLLEQLAALGYERTSSNSFSRGLGGSGEAVIDVLGPSGGDRLETEKAGEVSYDAIPGLGLALARPAVRVSVEARLTEDGDLAFVVDLPDPIAALVLKTLAWNSRMSDKDATDIWSLLEVCLVAGVGPEAFRSGATKKTTAEVLRKNFGRPGVMGVRGRPASTVDRITALVARVVGVAHP